MHLKTKLAAGLYGVVFHVAAVAFVAAAAARNKRAVPGAFWFSTLPPLLLAAFGVYVLIVGPYLARRPQGRGRVFYDSAVGMFAEVPVVVTTCALYGALTAVLAPSGSGSFASDAAQAVLYALLWCGAFFTQILVLGNAAGLVGWVVLKKLAERGIEPARTPTPKDA